MARDKKNPRLMFGAQRPETSTESAKLLQRRLAKIEDSVTRATSGRRPGLLDGISVVIPSYRGRERIKRTLNSLATQTLEHSHYEIIIVINGPDDGTRDLVRDWAKGFPEIVCRFIHIAYPSVSTARNLGIRMCRHKYVTFVDDDDYVQPRFLEALLKASSDDAIAIAPILDQMASGPVRSDNLYNARIQALSKVRVSLSAVPWALGFNAAKAISVRQLEEVAYKADLRSGEDVVFWSQFLSPRSPNIRRIDDLSDAAYVRTLRDGSVSRQDATFQFMVSDRLAVIEALGGFRPFAKEAFEEALDSLARSQLQFVQTYMEDNPQDFTQLEDEVRQRSIRSFPWDKLSGPRAKDLVIAYCFAPYSDTSAIVAAKAIAERGKRVDVIANDMAPLRQRDASVAEIAGPLLASVTLLNTPPSFASWKKNAQFAQHAVRSINQRVRTHGGYETLYSRALWVGSHLAAALYKLQNPKIVWTAEFSDPLRRGVDGRPRAGSLEQDAVARELLRAVRDRGFTTTDIETMFDLVEIVTYALADDLVFTNSNQMEYMLSLPLPRGLARRVQERTTIRPHPTLPFENYSRYEARYRLSSEKINIGYFGAFYDNRGLDNIFTALLNLDEASRSRIELHVFCDAPSKLKERVNELGLWSSVQVSPYLRYFEFLNLTTQLDVLLVNDVDRGKDLSINPFLPSKYSDYLGAGTDIWVLYDEGSPLSRADARFRSHLGSQVEILGTLKEIASTRPRTISLEPQESESR